MTAQSKHRIATCGSDNQLILHEIDASQLQAALEAPPQDEAAQQAPLVTPSILAKVSQAHQSDINVIEFNPGDPTKLASVSDDGMLKIWQISVQSQACLDTTEAAAAAG